LLGNCLLVKEEGSFKAPSSVYIKNLGNNLKAPKLISSSLIILVLIVSGVGSRFLALTIQKIIDVYLIRHVCPAIRSGYEAALPVPVSIALHYQVSSFSIDDIQLA